MSGETFVIVKKKNVGRDPIQQPAIVSIVRTYETRSRAEEDLDLLRDTETTTSSFEIVTAEHIDA